MSSEYPLPDPAALDRVREAWTHAAFVADVGIELVELGGGWAKSRLSLAPRHGQAQGVVHAGVQSTMADHSAGAAGTTLLGPGKALLTVDFRVNLLRPAMGEELLCEARVLKPGRAMSVVESEVFAKAGGKVKLVSKAIFTLAVIELG